MQPFCDWSAMFCRARWLLPAGLAGLVVWQTGCGASSQNDAMSERPVLHEGSGGATGGQRNDSPSLASQTSGAAGFAAVSPPSPDAAGAPNVAAELPSPPPTGLPIDTVYLVTLGDADWARVKGNPSAPFINTTLLSTYAHAENYHTPWHPNLPNYCALEAGDSLLGITPKKVLDPIHRTPDDHLTAQLHKSGRAWRAWYANMPGGGSMCPLVDSAPGWSSNDAAILFFDDVTGSPPTPSNAYCLEHVRPFDEMLPSLATSREPPFNLVVSTTYARGAECPPDNPNCDRIRAADGYLADFVPRLQAASPAYRRGTGVIFIVWIEPTRGDLLEDNRESAMGFIAVSPNAKPGYASQTAHTHASTVKTIQKVFGLSPLLRTASDPATNDLGDLFTVFP